MPTHKTSDKLLAKISPICEIDLDSRISEVSYGLYLLQYGRFLLRESSLPAKYREAYLDVVAGYHPFGDCKSSLDELDSVVELLENFCMERMLHV